MDNLKELPPRALEIVTIGGGLDLNTVVAYRNRFQLLGFDVPEWQGKPLPQIPEMPPVPYEPVNHGTPGVGTIIRTQLYRWGIKESDCSCSGVAKLMDEKGLEWCRENVGYLSGKMADNAKRHKWMRFAPFKRLGTRRIIQMAIDKLTEIQERQKISDSIIWAAGMTTAPRKVSTIRQALLYAKLNGWDPVIFAEPASDLEGIIDTRIVQNPERKGIWYNWFEATHWLLRENPDATHILTMQDDCVLVHNAKKLIEKFIPDWPADAGFVSLYLPSKLSQDRKGRRPPVGIHPVKGHSFHGSLAVVYRRQTLERILNHRLAAMKGRSLRLPQNIVDDDIAVGQIVQNMRLRMYYTFPSCSQHVSVASTRGPNLSNVGVRCANWTAVDALTDCVLQSEE